MAATRALTFSVTKAVSWSYTNPEDPVELSTPTDASAKSWQDTNFTSGFAINQGDRLWKDTRSLAATTSESLDMYDLAVGGGAAGTDAFGLALTNARLKVLIIRNKIYTVGYDLHIGGDGTAAAFSTPFNSVDASLIIVGPGGSLTLEAPSAAGYVITDTDNHLLKINNPGAGTIDFDIVLVFGSE